MLKTIIMISAPILVVLACLNVSWAPFASSILVLEFAGLLGYAWFVTVANGIDRINGTAPDQIAAQRANELIIEALEEHRRQ